MLVQTRKEMSTWTKAEMGIVGGFTASVMMGLSIVVLTAFGLIQVPWFSVVGYMFGATGPAYAASVSGLIWFMGEGAIAGFIFAFFFRSYSVNKGLGFSALGLIITALILSGVVVQPFTGTLVSMGLGAALTLFVPLAVAYVIWGIVMGVIARRYLR